jgi:hypothetical protein
MIGSIIDPPIFITDTAIGDENLCSANLMTMSCMRITAHCIKEKQFAAHEGPAKKLNFHAVRLNCITEMVFLQKKFSAVEP